MKNIAFLMDRRGQWKLSPAFDVVYSFNPSGDWTSRHQMSLNGKRDDFSRDDLLSFGKVGGIKKNRASQLLDQIATAITAWAGFAIRGGVPDKDIKRIELTFRKDLVIKKFKNKQL